jgi:hypothetical protein
MIKREETGFRVPTNPVCPRMIMVWFAWPGGLVGWPGPVAWPGGLAEVILDGSRRE